MTDVSFDGRAGRFVERIYGSSKGALRLTLLWEDMLARLPLTAPLPGRIWDAGGGAGQLTARLASLGHDVLLTDLSAEMVALARETMAREAMARETALQRTALPETSDRSGSPAMGSVEICCAAIRETAESTDEQFPLITCHAVLEWLRDPAATVAALASRLAQGGWLSLMFYNRDALIMTHATKGNVDKLLTGELAGHPGGLTPPNPIDPRDVEVWLGRLGLRVESRFGVRTLTDYLPRPVRAATDLDTLFALERQYGQRQPFIQLARYQHWVCRKDD